MPVGLPEGYRAGRLLRAGGGVSTWAAREGATGEQVVVKLARLAEATLTTRLRLEHDAGVLLGLGRPLLLDYEVLDGTAVLVRPFLPGQTLRDRLARGGLDPVATLQLGIQVSDTLELLHEHGVVHRDLKPANIVLAAPGEPMRASVVDAGLARGQWRAAAASAEAAAAGYLAPEAAGPGAAPLDARADLFSLGVVLSECLAGAPAPGRVPRALGEALARLVAAEPAQRYHSAAALAADLREILAALTAGDPDPAVVLGRSDRRRALSDPAFVGRRGELARLADLAGRAARGEGGLLVLEAEPGAGKTRLLDELARTQAGSWVLRGQGVDRAGCRPFQVLDGVAEAVSATLRTDPELARRLHHHLGGLAGAAVAALPGLGRGLGLASGPAGGPEAYGQHRSLAALRCWLAALGTPCRPVLVLLDDVQWADALTYRLLDSWLHGGGPRYLSVVAAVRGAELPDHHPLRRLQGAERMALAPLGPEEVRAVAESMAGPLPEAAVRLVGRLAAGNPFLVSAVLRGLLEGGVLVDRAHGWRLVSHELGAAQATDQAVTWLLRRLGWLSGPARAVLDAGAVLGKEFDLHLALGLSGVAGGPAAAALAELAQRRLVWLDEDAGRGVFLHDRLREAALAGLSDRRRRELHRRAADALLAGGGATAFELAFHLGEGGRLAEALPHALEAAELARSRHCLDVAASHYRLAARAAALGPAGEAVHARIAEGLGDVLALQGDYPAAAERLRAARERTEDPVAAASLEGKLGNVAFQQGDLAAARAWLASALGRLGHRLPRHRWGLLARLAVQVAVQLAHTLLPGLLVGRRRLEGAGSRLLAARLYSRLAYVNWFSAGALACAWAHLRGLNLAERYPPTPELGQAWSEHAPVCTVLPWFARGIRYAERSRALRRGLGDLWGEGQSASFAGVVLYSAGRYRDCLLRCTQAAALLERAGDRWEANTARWNAALAHYRLGELSAAAEQAREVHRAALAIGDTAAAGIALSVWARATEGAVPAELVATELARGGEDAHTRAELHLAEALRRRRDGDLPGAAAALAEAAGVVHHAGLRHEYAAAVFPWQATVLRELAETTPAHGTRLRLSRLRAAGAATRRARRWARWYGNNLPHALREAGLVASLAGRRRRAARLLARSAAVARAQQARREEELSAEALARLRRQWAGASAEPAGRPGPADGAAAGGLPPRFAALLRAARGITAAGGVAEVYAALRPAAAALLPGDHCAVVVLAGAAGAGAAGPGAAGAPADPVARTLVDEAVRSGSVVAACAVEAGAAGRCLLAAPVVVHGRAEACLLLTRRPVAGPLGEEEVQLADLLATLAAAALEHVAGSQSRLHALVRHSTDVLTLVTPAGQVVYQSSSAQAVFGLEPEQLVGQPVSAWVHPQDAPLLARRLRAAVRAPTGEPGPLECRVRHADGRWRHTETTVANLLDDPGVAAVVLHTRDVTERRELEEELRHQAWHDPLTGLGNRALFAERVRAALAGHGGAAVLFLDLDDFKAVNDTRGHRTGDRLLCVAAARVAGCLRPQDSVARLGGDEFAALLPGAAPAAAREVAERIRRVVSAPVVLDGVELAVRASLGIAVADPADTDPEALLARADLAMYAAKAGGRDRCELFHPDLALAATRRAQLRDDLAAAVSRNQLELHYQPIVRLATGAVTGVEALLRWHHPRRGLLGPEGFIDLAEDSGLILPLGDWAVRTALGDLRHLAGLDVAVNVSARQLQDPGLVSRLAGALARSGVDPGRLVVEITESAAIADVPRTVRQLRELRGLGVQLALDDFGTGYSSLTYLRRFPVDYLKIDRSFTGGVATDAPDAAIVRSVIELAHSLGLATVAEGVEQPEQLATLAGWGCDFGQGYLWHRPGPLGAVSGWLALPRPRQPDRVPPGRQLSARG